MFGELRSLLQRFVTTPEVLDQIIWILLHEHNPSHPMRFYTLDVLKGYHVNHLLITDLIIWVLDGAPHLIRYTNDHMDLSEPPDHMIHLILCGWAWTTLRYAQDSIRGTPNALVRFEKDQILYFHSEAKISFVSNGIVDLSLKGNIHAWVHLGYDQDREQWPGLPEDLVKITTEQMNH